MLFAPVDTFSPFFFLNFFVGFCCFCCAVFKRRRRFLWRKLCAFLSKKVQGNSTSAVFQFCRLLALACSIRPDWRYINFVLDCIAKWFMLCCAWRPLLFLFTLFSECWPIAILVAIWDYKSRPLRLWSPSKKRKRKRLILCHVFNTTFFLSTSAQSIDAVALSSVWVAESASCFFAFSWQPIPMAGSFPPNVSTDSFSVSLSPFLEAKTNQALWCLRSFSPIYFAVFIIKFGPHVLWSDVCEANFFCTAQWSSSSGPAENGSLCDCCLIYIFSFFKPSILCAITHFSSLICTH